ncbi:MAG: PhzF family phenazine biosynthesis protein [Verrucomicrobiota bacterium]
MSGNYEFVQLDVFTKTPLTGNPLAIFTDARGLTDQQMQALAREMNLSETTFILPREPEVEAQEGKRVRIFTVEEELPFAGHPTLGTALYLFSIASPGPDEIALSLNVGKIDIRFRSDRNGSSGPHPNPLPSGEGTATRVDGNVFGEMRQRDPEFGPTLPRDKVADVLGTDGNEIATEWPSQIVSTGLPFGIVPIRHSKSLANLKPDVAKATALLKGTGARFIYFICPEETKGEVRARMFFYGGEDPATGSAAGCAISWMVRHGLAQSDEPILIRQGVEAGRPSEIFVRALLENEKVTNVRVGGYAVEVLRGTVRI